jgi:thioesterase domain-containing protein
MEALTSITDLRAISPEQPLYGIQARGLDGKEAPFTNVKEMAAQYIKEIRLVQPKGPYIISGFSMGGVVIYEMAQQLQREGEKPSLVIFLDAPSPNYPEMLEKQNKSISKKIRNLLDLPAKKRLAHLITRFSKRWRELQDEIFSQFYLLIKQPLPPALRIHVVRKTNQLIADLYQPTQYSGDIIVLSASEQIAGAKPDQTLGWGQYVTGTIHNTVIPGNHETIFQEPNVGLLAQQIQISIDNWLQKNQTS